MLKRICRRLLKRVYSLKRARQQFIYHHCEARRYICLQRYWCEFNPSFTCTQAERRFNDYLIKRSEIHSRCAGKIHTLLEKRLGPRRMLDFAIGTIIAARTWQGIYEMTGRLDYKELRITWELQYNHS